MPDIPFLDTPAVRFLAQAGIPYRIFQHFSPIHSLQEAAAERGQSPDQIVRSILFRLNREKFVLVLMAGDRQISWKALRSYLGERRIALASPQEVLAQTGHEIGAVSPIGILPAIRILADPSVFAYPEISLGSGKKGLALLIRSPLLKEILENLEIAPLGE